MSPDDMLLHHFTITHVLDCIADPTKNRVIAQFSDHIDAVFPYLNAILPNLIYNPAAKIITIKRESRILTFYPHVAVMAKVDGEEDAMAQLAWFQDLVNDVWRQREQLTPCYEPRKHLGPLDVYSLLPGLNCKACGEATCMAFAFALLMGGRDPSDCPRLLEPAHAEIGQRLIVLLGATSQARKR